MSVPASQRRPIWSVLEHEGNPSRGGDAAHWAAVYADLLALLSRGARVTVTERRSGEHISIEPDEVSERLLYWRDRLEGTTRAAG